MEQLPFSKGQPADPILGAFLSQKKQKQWLVVDHQAAGRVQTWFLQLG